MDQDFSPKEARRYLLKLKLFEIEKQLSKMPRVHPQFSGESPTKSKILDLYDGIDTILSDTENRSIK